MNECGSWFLAANERTAARSGCSRSRQLLYSVRGLQPGQDLHSGQLSHSAHGSHSGQCSHSAQGQASLPFEVDWEPEADDEPSKRIGTGVAKLNMVRMLGKWDRRGWEGTIRLGGSGEKGTGSKEVVEVSVDPNVSVCEERGDMEAAEELSVPASVFRIEPSWDLGELNFSFDEPSSLNSTLDTEIPSELTMTY